MVAIRLTLLSALLFTASSMAQDSTTTETDSTVVATVTVYDSSSGGYAAATTMMTSASPSASPSKGGYVCNPAHSYPSGYSCIATGATPTLAGPTGKNGSAVATKPASGGSGGSGSGTGGQVTQINDGQPQMPTGVQPAIATGAAFAQRPAIGALLAGLGFALL